MDKAFIVKFIKEKNKNIYDAIVNEYSSIVQGWPVNLLKRVIEIDLEQHTGEKIKLHYHALCKAVKKFKKKGGQPRVLKKQMHSSPNAKSKYDFKDAHELEKETSPGSFKIK